MIFRTSLTSSVMSLAALQYCVGVIYWFYTSQKRNKDDPQPSNLSDYIRMSLADHWCQHRNLNGPQVYELSVKKHGQVDKRQAPSYASPGVDKNWKGQNFWKDSVRVTIGGLLPQ